MANGFDNDILFALNADFSGAASPSANNGLITNGQIWIGSTTANTNGSHVGVGSITSPFGTLDVGYSSGNITIDVAGGSTTVLTLSDDSNTTITPSSGNIQVKGHVVNQSGTFSTSVAGTHILNINPMSPARWIVDPLGFNGTHTTIASAVSAASAGDTILLMPGSYTENPTISKSLQISSFYSQGGAGGPSGVTVTGEWTVSAGSVNLALEGLTLVTNSNYIASLTGSSSQIFISNCTISVSGSYTGFTQNASSSNLWFFDCNASVGSSGVLFSLTAGNTWIINSIVTGGSQSTSTIGTGGQFTARHSLLECPLTTSGTGQIECEYCSFGPHLTPYINSTWITTAGTASSNIVDQCQLYSGTASAVSVGSGTTLYMTGCTVNSSNTDALTGAGTIYQGSLTFSGSSALNNCTTQTILPYNQTVRLTTPGSYPYTVLSTDYVILTSTSAAHTIDLPNAPSTGQQYIIKDVTGTAGTHNISVTTPGGTVTIDGSTTYTMNVNYGSLTVVFDGSNYWSI